MGSQCKRAVLGSETKECTTVLRIKRFAGEVFFYCLSFKQGAMRSQKNKGKQSPVTTHGEAALAWIFLLLGVIVFPLIISRGGKYTQETTWFEFENKILNKRAVERLVVVNQEYVEIFLKPEFQKDTAFVQVFGSVKRPNSGPH